jgi:transcriptional regulator with XRE-family HTH domain
VRRENISRYLGFIAANLRRYRRRRGLTQEGLAESADLDLRFVQRIEHGSTNLSVSALVAIATALEVSPSALFKAAKLAPTKPGRPPKEPASQRRPMTGGSGGSGSFNAS